MPENAGTYIDLGWEFHAKKQYDQAIEQFRKAIEMDGHAVDAYYGLGLSCKAKGEKEKAIQAFEKVIELAPLLEDRAKAQILSRLAHAHLEALRGSDGEA
ncbi:Lipopolysaccharide assembly protein B [Candidatus Thermoflexus japonica]|uniref:Lipopolysaccharide assembly protein B n=1 Tax=Candidatus Thermoflexus japonica TaxID=2035417 RepID=A0A2H5Y4N3_9CHLR|nr:Lipopolysaccharide assembly protein B [Candidatus Thermoflexus japonica]